MNVSPQPLRWPARRAIAMLGPVFAFYCFLTGTAPTFYMPNEALPVQQALAIYSDRTLSIDGRLEPYKWGYDDTVLWEGKRYPNKSPGGTLALLAAAPVIDAILPGPLLFRQLAYGGRVLMLTAPFMFFLFWFGRRLEEWAPPEAAWGIVLAYALGSNAGVYATLFFTHNLAAMCHGAAFFLIARAAPRPGLAGLLCGTGILFETSTMLAAPFLLFLLESRPGRTWRERAVFAAGFVPAAAVQAVYQHLCFGNAWTTPQSIYHAQRYGADFLALGAPSLRAAAGLTFSPARGAFFQSPWMLAAVAAVAAIARFGGEKRRTLIVALALPFAQLIFISCYRYWDGGWGVGARYLSAFFPLWAFAAAAAIGALEGRARTVLNLFAAGAGAAAIVEHAAFLASVPYHPNYMPNLFTNFLTDLAWPMLQDGYAAFTAAGLAGVPVKAALGCLAVLCAGGPAVWAFYAARGKMRLAARAGVFAAVIFGVMASVRSEEPVMKRSYREVLFRNHYEQKRVAEHTFRREWLYGDDLGPAPAGPK